MEFRDTLLAAQRNQQLKQSENARLYKARFDPPKKEKVDRPKDRLSQNILKFLAKQEEEEKQKQLEAARKRDELLSKRDTKAMNKIRKTLKVIKSANKSVLSDAIDTDNTAITLEGPLQPDQDDYGYESQEAAAIYQKMMEKYSKIPEESKFPVNNRLGTKKDIENTRERVKYALQHKDDPIPHKRKRKSEANEVESKEPSPPPKTESEKKKDKPKFRKPMPPPMDFNQLLKLAEQKKAEPIDVVGAKKKQAVDNEPERPMTKKQRKEYEEEMARKMRRQQLMEQQVSGKKGPSKEVKQTQPSEKKVENVNRIPKLSDKMSVDKNNRPSLDMQRHTDKEKLSERERLEKSHKSKSERDIKIDKEKFYDKDKNLDREKTNYLDREKLDRIKMERLKMKQNMESKNSVKNLEKSRPEHKSNIELKSQNTYRIDKNSNEKKFTIPNKNSDSRLNGHNSQQKPVPKEINRSEFKEKSISKSKIPSNMPSRPNGMSSKQDEKRNVPISNNKNVPSKRSEDRHVPSNSKPKITNSFDFDKHLSSMNKAKKPENRKSDDARRKAMQKRRIIDSEEEDSEMDDFIDDGDEEEDYSKHIKEIFGYDKSRYRDDDDDPDMESSFARQMREEYISKKIGIMEDLEDMKMEAEEKKRKTKRK